jgi:hypothetical protein
MLAIDLDAGLGDGSVEPPDGGCVEQIVETSRAPFVVELLLDRSSSMLLRPAPEGPDLRNKLEITVEALKSAIARLPEEASVGLSIYPLELGVVVPECENREIGERCCLDGEQRVAIESLGGAQRSALGAELDALEATGLTPTYEAFRYAVTFVEARAEERHRFIVLLTDGAPNPSHPGCFEGDVTLAILSAVRDAREQGILTYVIGSPGSEVFREGLSQLAEAGGTASPGCSHAGAPWCHFDMTTGHDFAAALNEALDQVVTRVIPCAYEIPEPGNGVIIDRSRVNIQHIVDDRVEPLLFDSSEACSDGWQYAGDQVELCPATCARVQADPRSKVEILFGCATRAVVR